MTRVWTRSWVACSVRKDLIFMMLCCVNLNDHAFFKTCSLKDSWSSRITPPPSPTRFLAESDGIIIDKPSWMINWCCTNGVAGKIGCWSVGVGWVAGDALSSMLRYQSGSLRSKHVPLDHLVEMRVRAVCHKHSNSRRNNVPEWWVPVIQCI